LILSALAIMRALPETVPSFTTKPLFTGPVAFFTLIPALAMIMGPSGEAAARCSTNRRSA
jgi:hypothetical protein